MKIEIQAETVATVEREREQLLFNVEFVYSTTSELLEKIKKEKNRCKIYKDSNKSL